MNNAQSGRGAAAQQREQAIGDYITACNAGDAEAVAATCTPDAVHYFPARMYGDDEPVRGGRAIGQKWARPVRSLGSRWSIDGPILCDPGHHQASIEFTAEQKKSATIIRGSEWYRCDPGRGLIAEIRAYLASPPRKASSGWSWAASRTPSAGRPPAPDIPGSGSGRSTGWSGVPVAERHGRAPPRRQARPASPLPPDGSPLEAGRGVTTRTETEFCAQDAVGLGYK